jgi:fumarate hydratase class I
VTTVLDVKVRTYPTHAAAKPVALIPNCAASRHIRFKLDGSGRALFTPPSGNLWPELPQSRLTASRPIDIDRLTREDVANWKAGDVLLLSGRLLTARDAAHQRIASLLQTGQQLPPGLNLRDRIVYYVGPVSPAKGEVVGPSGPTTANRMDRFTEVMLGQAGVLAMIGKAERGRETIASIQAHASAYLIAVGGAAYLISKAIRSARLVAFADLGMEAVYEFEVANMPVTVAVDSTGASLHQIGPAFWKGQLASEGPRIAVEAPK